MAAQAVEDCRMLTGKTVIVTGGAQGMGRAIALEAGRQGAGFVAVIDINETGGEATARDLNAAGVKSVFLRTDLSKAEDIHDMIEATASAAGGVDTLINNAGITDDAVMKSHVTFEDLPEEAWDRVMDVNLKAIWRAAKFAAPWLKKSQNGPSIVNAASVASYCAYPWLPAYTASKAAVAMLTQQMALDLGQYGIRCNGYAPGAIETPMLMHSIDSAEDREAAIATTSGPHIIKRLGKPEEVAKLACFLASDAAAFITGTVVRIDGGTLSWRGIASASPAVGSAP